MENSILFWIGFVFIGGIIGWLTGTVIRGRGFGVPGDMALGVGGAIAGGWVFGMFGLFRHGTLGAFSLTALAGTIALVALAHFARRIV